MTFNHPFHPDCIIICPIRWPFLWDLFSIYKMYSIIHYICRDTMQDQSVILSHFIVRQTTWVWKWTCVVSPTLLKTIIVFVNWEQVFCVIYKRWWDFFSMCNITAQYCYLLVISFITIVSFWRNYLIFY